MSQAQVNISHMQCWLFRLAQSKWKKTAKETTELFKQYGLLDYIAECYDVLHLSSYQLALHDLEAILAQKGVFVC